MSTMKRASKRSVVVVLDIDHNRILFDALVPYIKAEGARTRADDLSNALFILRLSCRLFGGVTMTTLAHAIFRRRFFGHIFLVSEITLVVLRKIYVSPRSLWPSHNYDMLSDIGFH